MAGAAIEIAALLAHEKAFCACFDRLTVHCPSLLLLADYKFNPPSMKKKADSISRLKAK